MENLRIYLLGTFRVYRDGALLTAKDWQVSHARQLFKLLFTERGHVVPASKVIDLLWPSSAEQTHKTLRGVVSILRSVLEPGRPSGEPSRFVPRGSLGYTLVLPDDGTVWVDTIEFERLLDEGGSGHESPRRRRSLDAALQLYTGDYLADDEHESWTLAERTRLRERYFSAALSLIETQRKLGLYNEAIAVGRRALSFDACREPLYPIIMYCQAALGDTVGALQTFEQCRQELHNRLGVDPALQTLKLHTELLRGELHIKPVKQPSVPSRRSLAATALNASTASGVGGQHTNTNGGRRHGHDPHLIGRGETMDLLLRSVEALQDKQVRQRTRALALVGEMGVGKSVVLRAALNHARSAHIATMVTECQALEQGLPFLPLLLMLKAWLAELKGDELKALPGSALAVLTHLLPELPVHIPGLLPASPGNGEQARSSYIASFIDLLQALGQRRPLIIAIDNLQWADEASVLTLHRLARFSTSHAANGHSSSLLLLLAYRPEEVIENTALHTMLLSLSRCNYFHVLPLARFSPEEVGDYLQTHNAAQSLTPDQCYQVTQGNALFLTETTRLLADQKVVQSVPPHDSLLGLLQHSTRIRDTVLARLDHLPSRARELLELAAVIGRPFPPALLSSPLTLTPEDYKLLDLLLTLRILTEGTGKEYDVYLSFSYELIAKVIYANCSALKRSQLHLRAAEQLACYYANSIELYAKEIAFHYRHAGPQYQVKALHYEKDT